MHRNRPFLILLFGVTVAASSGSADAHLHPAMQRFVQRDPIGYFDGLNQYQPPILSYLDQSGRNKVCNTTDYPIWIYVSGGPGWQQLNPGGCAYEHDIDMICPPRSRASYNTITSSYECFKIIDCMDGEYGNRFPENSQSPGDVWPSWPGYGSGYGNTFRRKCCCASHLCSQREQANNGGWKPILTVTPTAPPDYPPPPWPGPGGP
jgi:hypothetical protein